MIAHLAYYRAYDPAPAIERARESVAAERVHVERAIAHAQRIGDRVSERDREHWLAGKGGGGGGTPTGNSIDATARRLGRANESLAMTLDTKAHPASLHVAVVGSYEAREKLKARGYYFDRDGHWLDLLGARTQPAWCREIILGGDTDAEKIAGEIEWLREMGCEFAQKDWVNSLALQAARDVAGVTGDSIPY